MSGALRASPSLAGGGQPGAAPPVAVARPGAGRGRSIVEILQWRARAHPAQEVFSFVQDGGAEDETLSFAELDGRARAIGAAIASRVAAGDRAIMLYPPGLAFVTGLAGCFYASVVAVPAFPPEPGRVERAAPRLRAMIGDCDPDIVLTTEALLGVREELLRFAPELERIEWLATDATCDFGADWTPPPILPHTLAMLQYTSGSTAAPKGVILDHANILANSALIWSCLEKTGPSRGVLWLPPYHDMGMMGGLIQPIYSGAPATLMSPLDFLRRPLFWLEKISETRAEVGAAPDFAYELCVRKTRPEERRHLDLDCWKVTISGAEPVRPGTIRRFVEAFAPCGFRAETFMPAYGMAETTLIVSGGHPDRPPVTRTVDGPELERGRVVVAPQDARQARELVGCGSPLAGHPILIVDPETGKRCPPDRVGEIWVAGASIARGYWKRPFESEIVFGASLEGFEETSFLRTGDLGFLAEDQLFVTGRLKDLIVLRGRNVYPQDVEQTAEASHPGLRTGCAAAFAIDGGAGEAVVIALEVSEPPDSPAEFFAAIRGAIGEAHGVPIHEVVLIEPRSIPKTSSGKIQRRASRAAYLAGELRVIARDGSPPGSRGAGYAPGGSSPGTALEQQIARVWAGVLGLESVGIDDNFFDLGGSSLLFAETLDRLSRLVPTQLSIVTLFRFPTVRALAAHLAGVDQDDILPDIRERASRQRAARRRFAQRVDQSARILDRLGKL